MAHQAANLAEPDRLAIAAWLGANINLNKSGSTCSPSAINTRAPSWINWGAGPANTRFQSANSAGITAAAVPKLKLKWAFGFANATMVRSQPAVYGGRLFAGSQDGHVYALEPSTGCTYWSTSIGAEVRSAITVAGTPAILYFGDSSGQVNAVDAESGRILWQVRGDDHPATRITGAPVTWRDRVYVPVASSEEGAALQPGYTCCTFRGSVLALDAKTGRVIWRAYTVAEPPARKLKNKQGTTTLGPSGAAVWSSPTIDAERNALYVTTGDNYSDPVTETSDAVLAFDLDSGKLLWSKQFTTADAMNLSCWQPDRTNCPDSDGPDFDFGSPPILTRTSAKKRALILSQKSGFVYAVDPDQKGRALWQTRAGIGGIAGGIQWGPAADADRVYVAVSDMSLHPPAKRVPGGPRYEIDPAQGGGMLALRLRDGRRIWNTPSPGCDDRRPCSPAQMAAVSVIPGVVFSGAVDGHIRAYSTTDGRILWQFDTARPFETVNGVSGHGGSLDVAGPVVAGGMLFVNSGYNFLGGMAGNVLLAFAAE